MKQEKDVIVALDFPNKEEAINFLRPFDQSIYVKVGMELFYAEGPSIVREMKAMGHRVFLDLKFHDIPNTVAGAVRSCAGLGADLLNVHAGGGLVMMKAAVEALKSAGVATKLLAITQLTSTSATALKEELWIDHPLEETVLHYASLSQEAGLDGVVCSALEASRIHQELGSEFLTVTPGIRPASAEVGDQKRVVTPEDAARLGADLIVVGRPITRANEPRQAYTEIYRAFCGQ